MTTEFWLRLACGILWILGVWTAFKPKMILGWLGDWTEFLLKSVFSKEAAEYTVKPLFRCPPCCASFHGILVWFATGGELLGLFPFIVCLCGAMTLVMSVLPADE